MCLYVNLALSYNFMRKLKFKISVTANPVSIFLQQMRFYQDFCKSSHQGHKVVNAFLDYLNIPKFS